MIYSGSPGVAGNRSLGTPAGGGSIYDVAGPLAPSYGEAGQDPSQPVPAQKLPEQSSSSSWSDVWRGLAAGAGQLIIKRILGSEGSTGNRTTEVKSKGEIGSAPEPMPHPGTEPKAPSGSTANVPTSGVNVGLIAAGVLIVILLVMFAGKR